MNELAMNELAMNELAMNEVATKAGCGRELRRPGSAA